MADRWQISLADLIVLVLAVGVAAGVVHEAREVVGNRVVVAGRGREADAGSILARSARADRRGCFRGCCCLSHRGFVQNDRQSSSGWPAWGRHFDERPLPGRSPGEPRRSASFCVSSPTSPASSELISSERRRSRPRGLRWGANYRLRQGLLPVCGALAIAGLALGMGAGAVFDEPLPRRRRPAWLFVPLAGLIGVLLVVESDVFLDRIPRHCCRRSGLQRHVSCELSGTGPVGKTAQRRCRRDRRVPWFVLPSA